MARFLSELCGSRREFTHLGQTILGHANHPGLVGNRPRDRLSDPPRSVGGELESATVIEFLGGEDQPRVAFLDQVQERDPASAVAFGDGHDESQVAFTQSLSSLIVGRLQGLESLQTPAERGGILSHLRIR